MKVGVYSETIARSFDQAETLDIRGGEKVLVLSDLHAGDGNRGDDLLRNGSLLLKVLEDYYLRGGWHLVLNGDIEELHRYRLGAIRRAWTLFYDILDRFQADGRLRKIIGNHDEDLLDENYYPYPMKEVLRIEAGSLPIYVFHGHQGSSIYTKYNGLIRTSLRYIFKPLGIRNISSARSPRRRFHVEKQAYDFSNRRNIVSIIGHTHRALFESLGRFDYIKFEIERLCRDYPVAGRKEAQKIAREVQSLRSELGKLKRSERRRSLQESLYGDEFPVPCLFNSGSAIGKKGITAIELDKDTISLVYWFEEGKGKKFVKRGMYAIEALSGTPYRRAVLNHDRWDYVKARIELLG